MLFNEYEKNILKKAGTSTYHFVLDEFVTELFWCIPGLLFAIAQAKGEFSMAWSLTYISYTIVFMFGFLLGIFYKNMFVTVHEIHQEQENKIHSLEKQVDESEKKLKPSISVKPIIMEDGRLACIKVVNLGNETICNCVGYLHAVYWETNDRRLRQKKSTPSVCLQWSPRHGGEDKKKELTFTREADLNIVEFRSQGPARLCVFNSNLSSVFSFDRPYFLELGKETFIFDIEISAENCAPLRRKYKLILNPEGRLGFTIYEAINS